ncbi:MAG: four helix bundle protein [Cyanobacteria bacterium P01_F01_bin.56]
MHGTQPQPITERTFEFAVRIVKLCQAVETKSTVSRAIINQLVRSGTSVGANVEESQAGQSRADFVHKLEIALKELRETRYWLRLLVAAQLIPEAKLQSLINEADELLKILSKIIVTTKKNRKAKSSEDIQNSKFKK